MTGCFIIPSLSYGGAERVTLYLYEESNKKRKNHLIVLSDANNLEIPDYDENFVHFINKRRLIFAIPRVLWLLFKLKPDYLFSSIWHINIFCVLVSILFKKQRSIIREANYPQQNLLKFRKKYFFYKIIYSYFYKKANIVLSSSESMKLEIMKFCRYNGENIRVLYNPVDYEYIRKKIEQNEPDFRPDSFLCIGRLTYQKGFDRLIKLFPEIKNAKLRIIGEGEQYDDLHRLIHDLELNSRVFIEKNLDNPWKEIINSIAVVVPSRWEGMPNIVLESLACGAEIVASEEAGAITEIYQKLKVGQNRFHIIDSEESFVNKLNFLSDKKSSNCSNSYLPNCFRKDNVGKQFRDYLDDLS